MLFMLPAHAADETISFHPGSAAGLTLKSGSSKHGNAARADRDSIWVEASTCASPASSAHPPAGQACARTALLPG